MAASDKNRRPVPHVSLLQVALSAGRVRWKCPDAARLHYQRAKKTRQQTLGGWWAVSMLRLLPGPKVGTCRNLQHSRSLARTLSVRSRCGLRHETCIPGHHYGTKRAYASQSSLADIFTTLAVPDAVRPWMCVGTAATGHSLSPSYLDSRWKTAPSRNSNGSVRSRHCLQSERAADVGEIT